MDSLHRYTSISKAWCRTLGVCVVIKRYDKATRKQQRLAQREASMLKCLNAAGMVLQNLRMMCIVFAASPKLQHFTIHGMICKI